MCLSPSLSLIFHTPLLHNSCLYFSQHNTRAASLYASIIQLILIMKLVTRIYIRSLPVAFKCSEQMKSLDFKKWLNDSNSKTHSVMRRRIILLKNSHHLRAIQVFCCFLLSLFFEASLNLFFSIRVQQCYF